MVGNLLDVLVALGSHNDNLCPASLAFLEVRHGFIVGGALGGYRDHGETRVDKRDGTVLHLPCRICLGVQVADLFELERALVRDGRAHAAPHEQRGVGVLTGERRLMDRLGLRIENPLDLLGRVA